MDKSQIANIIVSIVIGLVLYGSSVLLRKFPPNDINALYGYRTDRSMKHKDLWNEGNHYSAILMRNYGLYFTVIGITVSLLFKGILITLITMGILIFYIILLFVKVENKLKKMEDDRIDKTN